MSPHGPIPIVALKPVSCASVVWRRAGALEITVVVKAGFGLVPDGDARFIAPQPIVAEDRHGPAGTLLEPSDLAPFLPTAGVMVIGSARARVPVPAMTVRVSLHRDRPLLDKSLHVFGDRPAGAPAPQPFQSMPLVYERAFGGPAFSDNPVGTGAAADSRAQPNVVHPADPRRPAGFGPVSTRWGSRRRLLGSRGAPALSDAWAEIPEGFDYRYYQAAPADQLCDYLHGDEWLALDGFDADRPRLQTRLPSVRAHAVWVSPAIGRAPEGHPVALLADTLLVDADRHLCSLLWRGHFTLERADWLPLIQVFATLEMSGYPLAWPEEAHVGGAPGRSEAEPEPSSERAPTERIVAAKVREALPFIKAGGAAPVPPVVLEKPELNQTIDAMVSPFRAGAPLPFKPGQAALPPPSPPSPKNRLGNTASAVHSPFAALPFVAPPAEEASAPRPVRSTWGDDDESTRLVDPAGVSVVAAPFVLAAPRAAEPSAAPLPGAPWSEPATAPIQLAEPDAHTIVAKVDDLERYLAARATPAPPAAIEPPPVIAPPPPVVPPPPLVSAPPALVSPPPPPPAAPPPPAEETGLRATLLARVKAREPLQDLPLQGADLRDLDLSGAVLQRLDLRGAKLARAKLAGARLADAQLGDADLSEADLGGADLGRADLGRATLVKARLEGASIADANFTGARGPGASFAGAKGARARFSRGEWEGATFARAELPGADFTGTSLAEASFAGATLTDARFTDARGPGVVLDEARLSQAQAQGAAFPGASLERADAAGSVWESADLSGANLTGAVLREATLTRASLGKAVLRGADLSGAGLQRLVADGADLREAKLDKADLRQARLREASFEGASLRGALAAKADLAGARFTSADLEGASLRAARLGAAVLVRANLEGADLRDAEMEGANLFGASRRTAKGAAARGVVEIDPGDGA